MVARAWLVSALCLSIALGGCGDSSAPAASLTNPEDDSAGQTEDGGALADAAALTAAYVRGRVTDATGKPVPDVEVGVDKSRARTDASGRFELRVDEVEDGKEVGVSVQGDKYSNGTLPVRVEKNVNANVELTVKERKMVMFPDSKEGGRLEADDGFTMELPPEALQDSKGVAVAGPVEVRYALVSEAGDVTAAPGRMQASGEVPLDGYGMVEVLFFQNGERLVLNKAVSYEIPLVADSDLEEGKEVEGYQLSAQDKRWQKGVGATVKEGKLVVKSDRDGWVGAAKELPVESCVSGRLRASADQAAPNTLIRAARARGLSLVQAATAEDGSFCLPVTPNDDWQVSAYFGADSKGSERGIQLSLNSSEAAGMCGGTGCKQVGDVELPFLMP